MCIASRNQSKQTNIFVATRLPPEVVLLLLRDSFDELRTSEPTDALNSHFGYVPMFARRFEITNRTEIYFAAKQYEAWWQSVTILISASRTARVARRLETFCKALVAIDPWAGITINQNSLPFFDTS